jgi:hypothetical protein
VSRQETVRLREKERKKKEGKMEDGSPKFRVELPRVIKQLMKRDRKV